MIYPFNKKLRSNPRVRLYAGNDRFFGPGTKDLLAGIRKTGSVQQACAQMDLSYSKGRHMIRHMEAALETTLVERTPRWMPGGGSAALTPRESICSISLPHMSRRSNAMRSSSYSSFFR